MPAFTFVCWFWTELVTRTPATSPVLYPLTALTSFILMLSVLFFLQLKIRKKKWNTMGKKNYKRLLKILHKKQLFLSLYTLHTEQAHVLRQHTHIHTHFAIPTLLAPLKIRLIRNRKIIIKLMKRVGKQNAAWQALLQTHTHTHTRRLMNTHRQTDSHSSWNYMFCSQIFFHSRNLATVVWWKSILALGWR